MPIAPGDTSRSSDSVVVVVPCLNEEEHIEKTLAHFMAVPAHTVCKIVVSDGGSTDRTVKIVEECALRDSRVVLLRNNRRIQSSGVNRAVEQYGDLARFIVRVDAHADYPTDFCTTLLAAQRMTGADSVVVSMIAKGVTCFPNGCRSSTEFKVGQWGIGAPQASPGRIRGSWSPRLDGCERLSLSGGIR